MNYKVVGNISLLAGIVGAFVVLVKFFTKTTKPKHSVTNSYGDWEDSLGI
jgi:hypothetical protein